MLAALSPAHLFTIRGRQKRGSGTLETGGQNLPYYRVCYGIRGWQKIRSFIVRRLNLQCVGSRIKTKSKCTSRKRHKQLAGNVNVNVVNQGKTRKEIERKVFKRIKEQNGEYLVNQTSLKQKSYSKNGT